jgi:cell division protein FtsW
MFFFIIVDYHFWANFAFIGYFVALLLIILVLTPLGFEANGARRWIDLKIISFQPAEVAKLAIILFFAVVIGRSAKAAHRFS